MHLFILIFIIVSCNDSPISYITNPADTFLSYKFNFKSNYTEQENYSLSLVWSKYPSPINIIDYNITLDPTGINQLTSTFDTTLIISNLNPGKSYPIVIYINPYLTDTLIAFTKPLEIPLWASNNNETVIVPSFDGSENYLNWELSEDIYIDSLFIFSFDSSIDYPHNTNTDSWTRIASLNNQTSNYTHQKNEFNDNYCYFLSYKDIYGNLSNSYIACDVGYQTIAPTMININSISNDYNDKIIIMLNQFHNIDFKSYTLWRSHENSLLENYKIPITKSYLSNQLMIDDRYDVKDRTYYYQLEVTNHYGVSSFSNIYVGSTIP